MPNEDQETLLSERLRSPIASGRVVDGHTLHITAVFDGNEEFWVDEVGFFLEDGTLLAVYSHPDKRIGFKNNTSEFIFAFDLRIATLPEGAVTIEETQQEMSLHMAKDFAKMAAAQINMMTRQIKIHSRVLELEGEIDMSLTEEISNLTEASNTLTQTIIDKEAVINQTLAEGMANLPSHMQKKFYVDPIYGDDANEGTQANPFKTILKAVEAAPPEGSAIIYLLGEEGEEYICSADEVRIFPRSRIILFGWNRQTDVIDKRKLVCKWYQSPYDAENRYDLTGFYFYEIGPCSLIMAFVDVEIEPEPTGVEFVSTSYIGFVSGNVGSKEASWNINITHGDITNNSTLAKLCSSPYAAINLSIASVTHSGMEGMWVNDIAAGTAPKDTGRILSNLPTL